MIKLIIVDDNILIRRALQNIIRWESLGLEFVGEAENGKTALALVEKTHPDLIITDIKMPGMDGLEFLKELSKIKNNIRTIIISAFDNFSFAKEAIKYGCVDYILKPIDPEEINESLKKACGMFFSDSIEKTFQQKIKGEINTLKNIDQLYLVDFVFIRSREQNSTKGIVEFIQSAVNLQHKIILEKNNIVIIFYYLQFNTEPFLKKLIRSLYAKYSSNIMVGISRKFKINDYEIALNQAKQRCVFSIFENFKNNKVITNYTLFGLLNTLNLDIECGNIKECKNVLYTIFNYIFSFEFSKRYELYLNLCKSLLKIENEFQEDILSLNYKLSTQEDNYSFFTIEELHKEIETLVIAIANINTNKHQDKSMLLSDIESFILNNFFHDINLNSIADMFYISPSYLSRIYKEKYNNNINKRITALRIEKSKKMLELTDYKIRDIAVQVGYVDSIYFSKVFKKNTQLTPYEYRISKKKTIKS